MKTQENVVVCKKKCFLVLKKSSFFWRYYMFIICFIFEKKIECDNWNETTFHHMHEYFVFLFAALFLATPTIQ